MLLLTVHLSNCSAQRNNEVSTVRYSPKSGCSSYTNNTERLKCVSELVSAFEDVQNSNVVVENVSSERTSEEYVTYVDRYCYESKRSSKRYLCFEVSSSKYEPTPRFVLLKLLQHVGVGFLFGLATGLYVTP